MSATRLSQSENSQSWLIPQKFILITLQAILLVQILELDSNHIYWYDIKKQSRPIFATLNASETDSAEFTSASNSLTAAIFSFLGFLGFEFLMLLAGVPVMFPSLVYLQNFFHLLGILFTVWFVLDTWQYT